MSLWELSLEECVFSSWQALVSMWGGHCAWLIYIDGKTSPLLAFSTAIDPLPAWLIFYKGIRSQLVSEFHFEFHICVTFPMRTPTPLHSSSVPRSWNIHLQSIYMFPFHSSKSQEYICIPKTKDLPAGKRQCVNYLETETLGFIIFLVLSRSEQRVDIR